MFIPELIELENVCKNNTMRINALNIDLSAHSLPKSDSKVCLYSPYESPIRKFTNFPFKEFEYTMESD